MLVLEIAGGILLAVFALWLLDKLNNFRLAVRAARYVREQEHKRADDVSRVLSGMPPIHDVLDEDAIANAKRTREIIQRMKVERPDLFHPYWYKLGKFFRRSSAAAARK